MEKLKLKNPIEFLWSTDMIKKWNRALFECEKLDIETYFLHEQPKGGKTIIKKFIEYFDVGFSVVLYSPDYLDYQKDSLLEKAQFRAHQNARAIKLDFKSKTCELKCVYRESSRLF